MDRQQFTTLLSGEFDEQAVAAVYPVVYDQLKRIAQHQLGRERSDHTLSATGLVHEAYLKLVDQERADYRSREHFLSVAALAMRRILVSHARRRMPNTKPPTVDEA